MPVLVYGSIEDLDLMLPLATILRGAGGEVRCYMDDDSYELRNLGCKIAVGRLDDESNLEGALSNVHTFIPLLPDPARIQDEDGLDWLIRLGVAAGAGGGAAKVQQTIVPLPAFGPSETPIAAAYSTVREEFSDQFDPLCLFSTGFVWGPGRPFTELVAGIDEADVPETQVSVVRVEDLAKLLAAADDRERVQGAWEFSAPPAWLRQLRVAATQLGGARVASTWMLDVLRDDVLVGSNAGEEFGVRAEALV